LLSLGTFKCPVLSSDGFASRSDGYLGRDRSQSVPSLPWAATNGPIACQNGIQP
jgi:hypothetical protein